jgi:hypothetical protein
MVYVLEEFKSFKPFKSFNPFFIFPRVCGGRERSERRFERSGAVERLERFEPTLSSPAFHLARSDSSVLTAQSSA